MEKKINKTFIMKVGKRMLSYFLSLAVAVTMMCGVFTVVASALSEAEFNNKIASLQYQYPNGSYWSGAYYYNGEALAWQCHGFACLMGQAIFGGNPQGFAGGWEQSTTVHAGDILRIAPVAANQANEGHSLFVTKVNGANIEFVDCNFHWDNKVVWGRTGVISNGKFAYYENNVVIKNWDLAYIIHYSGSSLTGGGTSVSLGQNPVGCLDLAESTPGKLHVTGWAYDPDDSSKNIEIHIYIGGSAGSNKVVASKNGIIANTSRPDVNQAFGISGNHGFDATFDVSAYGTYSVYAYAINIGGGNTNPEIGHKDGIVFENPNLPSVPAQVNYPVANGTYTIRNAGIGYQMNVYNGNDNNGTKVCSWGYDGSVEQKFRIYHENNGQYWIYAMCSSNGKNRVLDINMGSDNTVTYGDYLDIWTRGGYDNCQLFNIVRVGENQYVFELAAHHNAVLTLSENKDGAAITLQRYNGSIMQRWVLCDPNIEAGIITYKDLSNVTVTVADQTYTGAELKPKVTVKYGTTTLTENTDYFVTYDNNVNPGTANVTITGNYNYMGSKSVVFKINPINISGATISSIANQTFNGSQIKPTVTVKYGNKTLQNDTDYTIFYGTNTNAGTGSGIVTITGKGNYTGDKSVSFNIVAKSVSGLTISSIASQTYTGSQIQPAITVKDGGTTTLTKGTDYTVLYGTNKNVGTNAGTVTITGKGNYTGTKSTTFSIGAKSVSGLTISSIASQTYTGSQIQPAITVKDGTTTLTKGTDYTVLYGTNKWEPMPEL